MTKPSPSAKAPDNEIGAAFEGHRRHLLAVAYRFLGSISEGEDIVQETYLRWAATDIALVENPRAFLTRIAARLCLDQLKSARVRRERYVGPWLPEPIVSLDPVYEHDTTAASDDISHALLLALERLSPLERAAFVLHDLFDEDFEEISATLQRSPAACRQLAARARKHVRAARPRFSVSPHDGARLVDAFLLAIRSGDLAGLTRLLVRDAVLQSDSNGKVRAARREVVGADRIARLFISLTRRLGPPRSALPVTINGSPGLLMQDPGGLLQTLAFEMRDGRITSLYLMRNPEKLRHLAAPETFSRKSSPAPGFASPACAMPEIEDEPEGEKAERLKG